MGLVGKAKRGGSQVGVGPRDKHIPCPKGPIVAQLLWIIAAWTCNPVSPIFQEKQEILIFFLVCKWGRGYLLIFQCWQLIQKFEKQPAGQRKHIHSLRWLTGCQLLASSLKEMGRNRHL